MREDKDWEVPRKLWRSGLIMKFAITLLATSFVLGLTVLAGTALSLIGLFTLDEIRPIALGLLDKAELSVGGVVVLMLIWLVRGGR